MSISKYNWVSNFYNDLETKIMRALFWEFDLGKREYFTILKKLKKIIEHHKEIDLQQPIVWNGTQKQFAELVIELKNKGWIENNEKKSIANVAKEFASVFDLTGTKKSKNSNEENSFYQILKPQQNKGTDYEKIYPQIYSKRYKPCFNLIKERLEKEK